MTNTHHRSAKRGKNRNNLPSIDFAAIFAILILVMSSMMGGTWFLLPVAMATLYRTDRRVFLPFIWFICVFTLVKQSAELGALDLLSLICLIATGFVLMKVTPRDYSRFLRWVVPISVYFSFLALVTAVSSYLLGTSGSLLEWAKAQVGSLPMSASIPEESLLQDSSWAQNILANGLFGAYGGVLTLLVFTNLVLDGFVKSLRDLARRGRPAKASVWDAFSSWKTPDLSLMGLVGGLGCLVAHFQIYGGQFADLAPLPMAGWSLLLWSLFCYVLQGLAVAAYALQRVTLPFKFLIILVIYLFQVPLLTLVGLGDLWFDFRSRIRSNQADSEDKNDF